MKKILLLLSFLVFTKVQYAQLHRIQSKSIFDCLHLRAEELKPLIQSGEVNVTETRHGVNIIEYLVILCRSSNIIELILQTNAELLDMKSGDSLYRLNTFESTMQACGHAIMLKNPPSGCCVSPIAEYENHIKADFLWNVFKILIKYKKKISSREVITCLNCFESTRMLQLLIAHNADISSYDSTYKATPLENAKKSRNNPDVQLLEDALKERAIAEGIAQ